MCFLSYLAIPAAMAQKLKSTSLLSNSGHFYHIPSSLSYLFLASLAKPVVFNSMALFDANKFYLLEHIGRLQ
jgi:hypothetical protein